jgi:pullulanase
MHRFPSIGRLGLWLLAAATILVGFNVGGMTRAIPARAADTTEVIVHYYRPAADYAGWDLWLWPSKPKGADGASYEFSGHDAFGEVADAQVPGTNTEVGIIVKQGNFVAKDVGQDRFVEANNGKAEVWLVQGDPNIYYSLAEAQAALKPHFQAAYLDGPNLIDATFTQPLTLSGGASGFTVTDQTTNQPIPVTAAQNASLGGANVIQLTLGSNPDVTHTLQVAYGQSTAAVMPRLVLNGQAYYYGGNDLGATYKPKATAFRVWAPTASKVRLNIFRNGSGDLFKTLDMKRSTGGTWYLKVKGNLKNKYYNYGVTHQGTSGVAVDPYAKNLSPNGQYGMIVDLAPTNPKGWTSDHVVSLAHAEDAVIYEVHVRDFSIDSNSGMKHKGQYLAFTETGTTGPGGVKTGVDSLKELGVTHVELMPTEEFAGSDTKPTYNWGYDPQNYDVPEGSYATTPKGTARITEFKQMVQALHAQHLGVIMDVVYPHTFSTVTSAFDQLVPQYYYRTDYQGNYTNGTGVGDETAAERPMVEKLVLDSVKYWMTQYHVDGFRFDQMALLGTPTVMAVEKEVRAIDPSAIMLGEPWVSGSSALSTADQFTKGTQKNTHVAVFNDDNYSAIVGSSGNASSQGYATGDPTAFLGVVRSFPGSIAYSPAIQGFTAEPDETINYISVHDNYTLWDHITKANPGAPQTDQIKMDELAETINVTSQGIPYIQGGDEFLRTKGGNGNSYNAGDAVNQLDWARKQQYRSVFDYYTNLIHLRLDHPAFRMTSAAMIQQHLRFLAAPENILHVELTGNANGDSWNNIDLIFNPTSAPVTVTLPGGTWTEVADAGRIGEQSLGTATGTVTVQPLTAEILYGGDVGTAVTPQGVGSGALVTVTFRVRVPANTPASDTVYIAGDIPQLGPWDPGKQKMQNAGNNIWTVTLQIPDGTRLQYKYTRGSWDKVESWGTITGLANRSVLIKAGPDGTQLVDDTATDWGAAGKDDHRAVQKWADLP